MRLWICGTHTELSCTVWILRPTSLIVTATVIFTFNMMVQRNNNLTQTQTSSGLSKSASRVVSLGCVG